MRSNRIDDGSGVVGGRDIENPNHAGLAVEPDMNGMTGELGARPAGETLVADTHRRHRRIFRRRAGTFPDQHLAFGGNPGQFDDRNGLVGRTGDRCLPRGEHDVVRSRFELISGKIAQLRRNLTSTFDDGAAVVEHGLRPGGAGVVRSRRRVLIDELEILGFHPQLLRRQHPEGHDRTGTALLGTGDDHAGAVAVDLDVRTRRTGEARPPRDRDADGLVVRQVVAVGRGPDGSIETAAESDLAVHLTGGTLDPLVDDVGSPKLDRIHTDHTGELVGVGLERPTGPRRGRCPHRPRRLMVGVDERCLDLHGLHRVRTGNMHCGQLRKEGRIGGVGAVVDGDPSGAGHERAVGLHSGGDVDDHSFATTIRRNHLLLPRKDELHGATGRLGERSDVGLEVEPALASETPAKVRHDHSNLACRHLQRLADPRPSVEGHLRRGPDRDLLTLPLGDNGPGFDRQSVAAVGDIPARDDMVGAGHCGVDITLFDRGERRNVGPLHGVAGDGVGLPVLVHKRRSVGHRRLEIIDDRKMLVVDDDRVDCGLCRGGVDRGDGRHQFALETDDVLCEQPPVGHDRAVDHVGYIGGGQHGEDTRHRRCRTGVELRDAGVRDARVAELGHQLAGQIDVGGVATAPGHLVGTVGTNETRYLGNGHLPSQRRTKSGHYRTRHAGSSALGGRGQPVRSSASRRTTNASPLITITTPSTCTALTSSSRNRKAPAVESAGTERLSIEAITSRTWACAQFISMCPVPGTASSAASQSHWVTSGTSRPPASTIATGNKVIDPTIQRHA